MCHSSLDPAHETRQRVSFKRTRDTAEAETAATTAAVLVLMI